MITLRCTRRLLTRLGDVDEAVSATSAGLGTLGDWYGNLLVNRPRQLVLCTNALTLLSVVVPLAPAHGFIERFREAARLRVAQAVTSPESRIAELGALAEIRLGRSESRSVLASMNQLGFSARVWLEVRPAGDLEELGQWLCDTPCSALRTHWPFHEAELLLTGRVAHPHIVVRPERNAT